MGTGLRFYRLAGQVFWHDEVHTALRIFGFSTQDLVRAIFDGKVHTAEELQHFQKPDDQKSLKDTLTSLAGHPEHSPLYYLLARIIAPYFDPPLAGARFLAALFGLLILPAIFRLTRDLLPEMSAAPWIAAMLASLSPLFILYSREARQYSLWTLLTVMCTIHFLSLWQLRSQNWVLYGVLLSLGLYSHLMFFWIIPAHASIIFLDPAMKTLRIRFIKSLFLAILSFTPWLCVLYRGVHELQKYTDWMRQPIELGTLATHWALNVNRLLFDLPAYPSLALISVPLVVWGALWTLWRCNGKASLLLGLTLISGILPVVIPDLVQGGQRSQMARYMMPALLCLEICLAGLLAKLLGGNRKARILGYFLLILIFISSAAFSNAFFKQGAWWNKFSSYYNPQIAEHINRSPKPLIFSNNFTTNPGDMLSLSYLVKPQTPFLLCMDDDIHDLPKGYELFVLSPDGQFSNMLTRRYAIKLNPVAGIPWWFWAKS
jgi:uncharacterized membrane protein